MKRFYEKKDHLIRKNPKLTDDEKQEIIELLGRHPSYENKIDWNKSNSLTYEDFLEVLRPLYINDLDPRGLIEGQDYDILYESKDEALYFVRTYDASKILASNNVEPEMWTEIPSWCGEEEKTDEAHAFGHFDSEHGDMKPGAKWCISMQTSDYHWNDFSSDINFFFWFRDNLRLGDNRKTAICVSKRTWEVIKVYNGADNEIKISLPSYITEAIENERKADKEKEFNRIKSRLELNPQTNRYDYDGDLDNSNLSNFVSKDKDGFTINFGKVTGNFDCSSLGLKSLNGAPQEVGRSFDCYNNRLTSLEGAPQTVGDWFTCYDNYLTSLKGAPQEVGGDFACSGNKLTSLEGAPQTVGKDFRCNDNQLTSLKGAPKEIEGNFDCSNNKLTSLEGAPQIVGRGFYCYDNQLISLKGAPKEVGKDFYCFNNRLTSLEGAPQIVGGEFSCYKNQLTSLQGAPQTVGEDFHCPYNKLTSLEGAPQKVGENFLCYNNQLTSLKGAPQTVGGYFDCRGNPNLRFLKGIGEVKGEIVKDF